MKVVILAGGFGTRIYEETQFKPKPMVEVNGRPIIWYVMKQFASYGFNDFIICAGYKQEYIKKWFYDYFFSNRDCAFDNTDSNCKLSFIKNSAEKWKVTIIDTGLSSNTGERINRVKDLINECEFFVTYGDCVSDIDISDLLKTHHSLKKILTLTGIQYPFNKGVIRETNGIIENFREKCELDSTLINGGFMAVRKEIFDYIDKGNCSLEYDIFPALLKDKELACYKMSGRWCSIDSLSDKHKFETELDKFNFNW